MSEPVLLIGYVCTECHEGITDFPPVGKDLCGTCGGSCIDEFNFDPVAIRAAAQELLEKGWLPIETALRSGTPILLAWRGCQRAHIGQWASESEYEDENLLHKKEIREGWKCDGDEVIPRNQHDCLAWMPLPELPDFQSKIEDRSVS